MPCHYHIIEIHPGIVMYRPPHGAGGKSDRMICMRGKKMSINSFSTSPLADFSAAGKALGTSFAEKAACTKGAQEQRRVLYDGFEKIASDPGTTDAEKMLAALGKKFDGETDDDTVRARTVVMNALASSVAGPPGKVIAKVTGDAVVSLKEDRGKRSILYAGLDMIAANPGATVEEKTLANLGKNLDARNDANTVIARLAVINAIASSIQGPIGKSIAKIISDATGSIGSAEGRRTVLYTGLDEISKNSQTTPYEKTLANMGKSLDANNDDNTAKARLAVINALASPGQEPVDLRIAQIVRDAVNSVSNDNARRSVLCTGFDTIAKAPGVTDKVKQIAEKGKGISKNDDRSTVQARMEALEEILEYYGRTSGELVKMAENLKKEETDSGINVQDTFIDINGVKLERKEDIPGKKE